MRLNNLRIARKGIGPKFYTVCDVLVNIQESGSGTGLPCLVTKVRVDEPLLQRIK